MALVRNETQRHSAALKSAGQSPIGLLPLDKAIHLICDTGDREITLHASTPHSY